MYGPLGNGQYGNGSLFANKRDVTIVDCTGIDLATIYKPAGLLLDNFKSKQKVKKLDVGDKPGLSLLKPMVVKCVLRELGYEPHLTAKEKARIVDKAEALVTSILEGRRES